MGAGPSEGAYASEGGQSAEESPDVRCAGSAIGCVAPSSGCGERQRCCSKPCWGPTQLENRQAAIHRRQTRQATKLVERQPHRARTKKPTWMKEEAAEEAEKEASTPLSPEAPLPPESPAASPSKASTRFSPFSPTRGAVPPKSTDLEPEGGISIHPKSIQDMLEQGIRKGSLKMVKSALDQNAELGATSQVRQSTPLMLACTAPGHHTAEIVAELLRRRSDVHHRDYKRLSCMHYACRHGSLPVVEVLFAHGGERDDKTSEGRTTLMLAAEGGHSAVVQALLEKGEGQQDDFVTLTDHDKCTALHSACKRGCADCVSLLLQYNAKMNPKDKSGRTALVYACQLGKESLVKLLIQEVADVNSKDDKSQGPLFYACLGGHDSMAVTLLKKKAQPEVKNEEEQTPVMVARRLGLKQFLHVVAKALWELEHREEMQRQTWS